MGLTLRFRAGCDSGLAKSIAFGRAREPNWTHQLYSLPVASATNYHKLQTIHMYYHLTVLKVRRLTSDTGLQAFLG